MLDILTFAPDIEQELPAGSAEYKIIVDAYSLLIQGLPTTPQQAHTRLSALDSMRPQLSALSYMISNKWLRINAEFSVKYNKDYTRWCQSGTKPSHAAIEAQVFRDDLDLLSKKNQLDRLSNLNELVKSLIRALDNSRNSVLEAWRDSNRL